MSSRGRCSTIPTDERRWPRSAVIMGRRVRHRPARLTAAQVLLSPALGSGTASGAGRLTCECPLLPLPLQPAQHRQRREVGPRHSDTAHPDVDRDPALLGPVNVPQVQQQGELIDDKGEPGAVTDSRSRMTPVPLLAADGDRAETGQQADAPQVVMQVLAADTDVPARSFAGPDAIGKRPQPGEGDGESKPAEQGGSLPGAEFLVVCAADRGRRWREDCHTALDTPTGYRT